MLCCLVLCCVISSVSTIQDAIEGIVIHLNGCESELGWCTLARMCLYCHVQHRRKEGDLDGCMVGTGSERNEKVNCSIKSYMKKKVPTWWRTAFFSLSERQMLFNFRYLEKAPRGKSRGKMLLAKVEKREYMANFTIL